VTRRAGRTGFPARIAAVRRRRLRSDTSLGILLLLVTLGSFGVGAAAEQFSGKVIGIADGDTIEVLRDRQPVKVRLNGIDAPEQGQAFGTKAKQFVSSLAFSQVVTVVEFGKDRYDQTIADVVLADARVLNREVARDGHADRLAQARSARPATAGGGLYGERTS
jgi:endonuclease YncB( thermonuclease family)